MRTRIVTDSSSNLFALQGVDFACVPMKIITRQAEYTDTPALDVAAMVEALCRAGGPSSSSCPNTHEWLTAFGDADEVFAVTITGTLSGSHSAAVQAAEEYNLSQFFAAFFALCCIVPQLVPLLSRIVLQSVDTCTLSPSLPIRWAAIPAHVCMIWT